MSHKLNVSRSHSDDDTFWSEHYPKLQRYCHFLAQNKWDGDDIAQETFLKALKYTTHPKQISAALLNKIAYHHWVDLLRKRKHENIGADSEERSLFFKNPLDEIPDSVDFLLKQFTPKQAVIFLLKEAFQYQVKEIAEILGTTEMAVKSNLHRAKKRLEKTNDEEQSFSIKSFWEEEEREQLSELFYESLKKQDPAVLIKMIPSIRSIAEIPQLASNRQVRTHSPSSTLLMAA
ncbi:sigma-70 family RNA polymerase sigma factor [Neobacillus kokaensis]|uniref:DNA-directed RNA polymerase sigma-70 factor n=1 Tax=Neobacillus kokaensis TaxID=2759023 RepID=A0ABQ3NBS1_9BACI|nr:sigma-70 family RNA polymerase sigma factor [Neobacillus kokaensis]GHI01368.1 DNA-directed RNA polymerase sigma-70 factor [Neobacillus kokaensis]